MRRLPTPAILAIAAATFAAERAAGQTPADPRAAEARGDSLMRAFDTAAAIAAYRQGLEASPQDVGLLLDLARALTNLSMETPGEAGDRERYEEAVRLGRRAIELDPDRAAAHATLAAALGRHAVFQGGRRKVELAREVREAARRAIDLDPGDFRSFIVLGVWNREVATLNPLLRGVANAFLGGLPSASLERSAAALERARRLAPDIVFTRLELGRTYAEMGRDRDARRELETAIGLEPQEALDRVLQREARSLLDALGGA